MKDWPSTLDGWRTGTTRYKFTLFFSLGFFAIHLVCYVAAGVIDLQLARHMYGGKNRLFGSFMRDTDDAGENKRIAALLSSQFVRAVLMSPVLYPILPFLTDLSFAVQFLFMSSLMLIYANVASAVPFTNTIEGIVYMKKSLSAHGCFGPSSWKPFSTAASSGYSPRGCWCSAE